MLTALAVANYRSLHALTVTMSPLNVISGENGSGKSNLYRALRLLSETARGSVVASLAREGGIEAVLWAGPEQIGRAVRRGDFAVQGTRRKKPVSLRLGFATDQLSYAIDLGMTSEFGPQSGSAFQGDPEIKRECIWAGPIFRRASLLADRRGPAVSIRGSDGEWALVAGSISRFDSMLTEVADPGRAPEILNMRALIRSWRFYDHFRTDADAPARLEHIGTFTPVLANDGRDLAAALQTIREVGDGETLDRAVGDAFPGSRVEVSADDRFRVHMRQPGLLRPLAAAELSDGTLRYLLWIAALLTPRPPALMVLNEPETSLHPDLLPPLARLIAEASSRTQLWVVSHSAVLLEALRELGASSIVLRKELGETTFEENDRVTTPRWAWPER
jgi:predicted ATPase